MSIDTMNVPKLTSVKAYVAVQQKSSEPSACWFTVREYPAIEQAAAVELINDLMGMERHADSEYPNSGRTRYSYRLVRITRTTAETIEEMHV